MRASQDTFYLDLLRDFYNEIEVEDRADYYDGCLQELGRRENERPKDKDKRLWDLLVWCDYEEQSPFVAHILYHAGVDIEQLLIDLLTEQQKLDRDAYEDYIEQQRTYREMQGYK